MRIGNRHLIVLLGIIAVVGVFALKPGQAQIATVPGKGKVVEIVNFFGSVKDGTESVYTVPAGKVLFLTDVVLPGAIIRNLDFEISRGGGETAGTLVKFNVPDLGTVSHSFNTAFVLKEGQHLIVRNSSPTTPITYSMTGYLTTASRKTPTVGSFILPAEEPVER